MSLERCSFCGGGNDGRRIFLGPKISFCERCIEIGCREQEAFNGVGVCWICSRGMDGKRRLRIVANGVMCNECAELARGML
jgi:hypothetical protein